MKRAFVGVTLLFAAPVLGGCPMYGSSSSSGGYGTCNNGYGCYEEDATAPSSCNTSADCGPGYECDGSYQCLWVGYDATADCSVSGCPNGQVCELANGIASCISEDAGYATDAGSTSDGALSTQEASTAGDVGASGDASDSGAPPAVACNADVTCGGNGAKCIDGQCAPQGSLCSDTSQCVDVGAACVDGVCLPRCSTASPSCTDGYACDFTRDVCDVNPAACSTSASCQGGSVCVDAHCVEPCTSTEAGAQCPSGLVCINGGCIPNQAATFSCTNNGNAGALANSCAGQDVCLHHSCYAPCSVEGGSTCGAGECKEVTVSAGTYAVCGTASTLGSQCDPGAGNLCATGVLCIDGYCVP